MNVMDHHTLTKWQPEPGCRTLFLSEQPTTLLFPFDSSALSFETHQGSALDGPKWSACGPARDPACNHTGLIFLEIAASIRLQQGRLAKDLCANSRVSLHVSGDDFEFDSWHPPHPVGKARDTMHLLESREGIMIGTRLAHYEVTAHLGSGGMGDVYQATDLKLGRSVALKLLPEAFLRDAERTARFEREARVLASLNHPHIAAIHELLQFEQWQFLVLELVEGETLANRLTRGPIPVEETLRIARQIAEGLEAAHEKGIVHRDLKPANIKITPAGNVKVLDFGLAKVRVQEGAVLSNAPTKVTAPAIGTIMGTAAYMSPEQTKGQDADRTSDVWAFGCVLYEMLTGSVAFEGSTVSEIFAGILKGEPDWRRLPGETPEGVRRLLRRCLKKEREGRLHDMADVRIEIDEALASKIDDVVIPRGGSRKERIILLSVLGVVTLIAVWMSVIAFRPIPQPAEMRLEINTPETTTDLDSLAISPDGQQIVFVANSEGRPQLWLRSLDSGSARPLSGTDYASLPFWSPDNRNVGFFADSKLKRIDVKGGVAQIIANAPYGRGGAWNQDGTILFAPSPGAPILRTSPTGGQPVAVTKIAAPQQVGHAFPQFLPDGHHFLYSVIGSPEGRGVFVGRLDGFEANRLVDVEGAVYATGQLLFVRETRLFAQKFDPVGLTISGNPAPLADNLSVQAVSASASGPIVFRPRPSGGAREELTWFDRSGKEMGTINNQTPNLNQGSALSLSPDGKRVAFFGRIDGNVDVWLIELARGVFNRFTLDAADDIFPVWSPDGATIAFSSNRGKTRNQDLYRKPVSNGEEELLLETANPKFATDWSPNSRFLLYFSAEPKTGMDIWALPMEGNRKPFTVVQTGFDERLAQFSPDGKWIAFESNESGRFQIYVQPFVEPDGKREGVPGGKIQISTNGGAQVRWRRDGKELFYIALDGRLMSVPIQFAADSQGLEPGIPTSLFATRVGGALQSFPRNEYLVSPDGQRFLMNTASEQNSPPITVILNWHPERAK
jgi:Tol biopolymer transport system component